MSEGGTRLAVMAGGGTGTLGRWLVEGSLPEAGPGWGWATLVVNVTGALALGLLVAWLAARSAHPLVRPFAAVGLLGGWTTYSTFALDVHMIVDGGSTGGPLGYVLTTLVLGVGAGVVGLLAGERRFEVSPARADRMVEEEEL